MHSEFGAYFFDSSLLGEKSEHYLSEAQLMVNTLLDSKEYLQKKEAIDKRQFSSKIQIMPSLQSNSIQKEKQESQAKVQPQNVVALVSEQKTLYKSSETFEMIRKYKQNRLLKFNAKFKRPRLKTQNGAYLNLGRKIFEKVNTEMKAKLGKRGEMMKEVIDEVNSKRFSNQEKWLERYLELKEEIKGHQSRIIALRKALNK